MSRTQTDRCPGVLTVHQAADGGLARVRLPGGVVRADQFDVLRTAAAELGDGRLELTSRANVQIRGLAPDAPVELSQRLFEAGLLPSLPHERVRNILASPLSGLDQDSRYDVLPVAAAVDRDLCARPGLAELPRRFLFALDDGRGDLAGVRADVLVRAVDERDGLLRLGTRGVRVGWGEVAEVMVAAAEAFLEEREGQEWRITELERGEERILDRLGLHAAEELPSTSSVVQAGQHGSGLVVTVPLGSLNQEQAAGVAAAARGGAGVIRVTPWRSVVVQGVSGEELERVGLVTDPDSAWNGVTACAGQPGCAKALADVRADARRVTPRLPRHERPIHWSGCERRCGKPAGEFVDVLAVGNGYVIDGERMGTW
ncbi:precorrin-3B synthase [Kribbella capetownensis]|uniref:Precorrin-3B synthase n=1 Tax=Kribbella capetownensis TaxID=1572659 RepID=A0A4R0JE58_9ACTN|nr:precorrin-3B synthase [Kribbella capetownensis]TCC42788.1 precorrin-3B synthase [Kribbella capetownensis]